MKHVILIGGMGRSGSTLLEAVIREQIPALGLGEVKFAWSRGQIRNELCGCGEQFRQCLFWNEIVADVFDRFSIDANEIENLRLRIESYRKHFAYEILGLRSSDYGRDLERYMSIYSFLYKRAFELSGSDVLIDSSKDPIHIASMSRLSGFNTHLIHLVRDPRAVAYSLLTPKVRKEVHWTTEKMRVLPPLRTALIWNFINFAIDEAKKDIPSNFLLRYEDFMTDRRALFEFLKRISDGNSAKEAPQWHSVSGNPVRFENLKPELKEDRRWVGNLGFIDRLSVELATAPLMRKYGYVFGNPPA